MFHVDSITLIQISDKKIVRIKITDHLLWISRPISETKYYQNKFNNILRGKLVIHRDKSHSPEMQGCSNTRNISKAICS